MALSSIGSKGALGFKLIVAIVGTIFVVLSLSFLANEFGFLSVTGFPGLSDTILIVAIIASFLSGVALMAELPNSLRIRFRRPARRRKPNEVYGFGTVFAIGLGSTLGSPLFLLIPLNVEQYEIVSVGSLILATILSVMMAKIYSISYAILRRNNLDSVGGPAFLRAATGKSSFRYFASRVSMAVANTTLAAYSAIVFVLFDFQFMPRLLFSYGITGLYSQLVIYSISGLFAAWFILNSVFEARFIRFIGRMQVVLTLFMTAILVYHSVFLGSAGSWNFTGLLAKLNLPGGNLAYALLINTGYLYLLFFGFQEIQAMERETKETSKIPIVSWIKKDFILPKTKYIDLAMISSVLVASGINIFYALAVYASHPNISALNSSQIPALYLAGTFLGQRSETLMGIAFLIATFTTFVPSFLAATRHLSSLAEDGFMPPSISRVSWMFVLVSIGILSLAGQNFLVSVTDFMVLVSLGLIAFSAIWIRKSRKSVVEPTDTLPLIVAFGCFIFAATVYFYSPSVAVFGSLAILFAYLLFDVFELGSLGTGLFLAVFDAVIYMLLATYPHGFISQNFFLFEWLKVPPLSSDLLSDILLISSALLLLDLSINVRLRRRPKLSSKTLKTRQAEVKSSF